jgi:hypothetical protein
MNAADRVIRWSTALAVLGVAAVAAVVSYQHASSLVRAHGESGWTGRLIPLTVDGLIYASSVVILDVARRGMQVPALARWLLGLGIVATLAANIAHGLGQGIIGAVVAAWPAVALVGSHELLMLVIRGAEAPAVALPPHGGAPVMDPLGYQAAGCSRLTWQLIASRQYVPSAQRCMLANHEPSGCANTRPRPPVRMAEAWLHKQATGEFAGGFLVGCCDGYWCRPQNGHVRGRMYKKILPVVREWCGDRVHAVHAG